MLQKSVKQNFSLYLMHSLFMRKSGFAVVNKYFLIKSSLKKYFLKRSYNFTLMKYMKFIKSIILVD